MDTFHDSIKRIENAAGICNSPSWLIEELQEPKRVIELKVRAITKRGKESFEAVRVHQTNPYPTGSPHPFKGGWRYMAYSSRGEMIRTIRAMANDMTLKNALTRLPFGGCKGCLNIDTSKYTSEELEYITKELVFEMLCNNILDPNLDVPGPDYGTNAETMKWMYIEYSRFNQLLHRPNAAAVVTGKPVEFDGIPGREEATARGGLIVFNEIVKPQTIPCVVVQGFGNVGGNICKLLESEEFWIKGKVVAVSEASSAIYNPKGLPYQKLSAYIKEHGNFKDCTLGDIMQPDEIFNIKEYDLFVTAAKEGLINKNNAHLIKSETTLLELGNSAITHDADEILRAKKVKVLPDILSNPGGVIVSSFEWRRNRGDVYHTVDLADLENWVYEELTKILKFCTKEVLTIQKEFKTDLRMAAHIAALKQLEFLLKRKHGYK